LSLSDWIPALIPALDALGPLVLRIVRSISFGQSKRFASRAKGLPGLLVPDVGIGGYRAKSVQESADAVAQAANGQSEHPVE
jgi:hypothetical protein